MPGAILKSTNFSLLLLPHKPYKFLNNSLSSSATTTTTTTVGLTTILRPNHPAGRWRGATTPFSPAKITPGGRRRSSRNGGIGRKLICNPKADFFGGAKMCVTVNGKAAENLTDDVPKNDNGKSSEKAMKLLTLPTMLTIGRVAAVPLLVGTFYVESWWGPVATTGIFIAAAFTDWLDGYLARKMNLGTQFGAFLDPVADKLMVAATLILLCTRPFEVVMFGQAPWLLTVPAIAIIGREITMSAVREWAASQDAKLLEAVAVNNLGKWKTAAQMIALTILLASRDSSIVGGGTFAYSGVVLLYISAWLALWSLFVYMKKIWKVLLK